MDITVPPEVEDLARRTRDFITDVVIPVEEEVGGSVHAAPDELRRSLLIRHLPLAETRK